MIKNHNIRFDNFNYFEKNEEPDFPIVEVKLNIALRNNSKVAIFEEDLEKALLTLFNNKICVEGIPSEVAYLEFIEATVKRSY